MAGTGIQVREGGRKEENRENAQNSSLRASCTSFLELHLSFTYRRSIILLLLPFLLLLLDYYYYYDDDDYYFCYYYCYYYCYY